MRQVRQVDPRRQWAHFGAAAAGWASGFAGRFMLRASRESTGHACYGGDGAETARLIIHRGQGDVEVGLVCLKSQWVHVRRAVLPGRGAYAMAAAFRRWTTCATAGTMARCAGAIAHEPGGGPDERTD